MDLNQLKQLGQLPDERLTAILVDIFGQIARKHSTGTGLGEFTWKNVEVAPNGRLFINWCGEKELDDDVRARNHRDYAGVVYCVATGRKSAESMQWDAERTVRQPVLREIVLTLCGRNDSEIPLLRKLCEPYVDEATFFADYLTVDEKEEWDDREQREKYRREEEAERLHKEFFDRATSIRLYPAPTPWYVHMLRCLAAGAVMAIIKLIFF